MSRKFAYSLIGVVAAFAFPATGSADHGVYVAEPTGQFGGEYETGEKDRRGTPEDESKGYQEGYIAVTPDSSHGPEVQACNGNRNWGDPSRPHPFLPDATGYIYVSPSGSGQENPNLTGETTPAGDEYFGVTDEERNRRPQEPFPNSEGHPCPQGYTEDTKPGTNHK